MHEQFIKYVNNILNRQLTDEEIEHVKFVFVPKKLRKHQFLLQEGQICNQPGFIIKGALKQYIVDESGKENILALYLENWWAGDRESFLNETPSPYNIDAFEDTDLLILDRSEFNNRMNHLGFMSELIQVLTSKQALQLLKRVHTTKALTAEQRISDLEKTYPEFFQRFPQHIIASYLGMTKETFSRVRANYSKK